MSAMAIRSRSGKLVGNRYSFAQGKSAKDLKAALKAALKAQGLKGSELTKQVNEVLMGSKTLNQQMGAAFLQHACQEGFIPDMGELRKTTGVLRFVKPSEVKSAPAVDQKELEEFRKWKASQAGK